MSHKVRTTSLTLFAGKGGQPVAFRLTLVTDPTVAHGGLFRSNGSGLIKDLGGDPGEWICYTSDHVMNVAMNDVAGFRLVKGICSMAKLQASKHDWKVAKTLAEWLASEHPLTETLHGVTIDGIRASYASFRGEPKPDVIKAHVLETDACECEVCKAVRSGLTQA